MFRACFSTVEATTARAPRASPVLLSAAGSSRTIYDGVPDATVALVTGGYDRRIGGPGFCDRVDDAYHARAFAETVYVPKTSLLVGSSFARSFYDGHDTEEHLYDTVCV